MLGMESENLNVRLKEWAAKLGFRSLHLASSQPASFTLLTATPRRRHLFEILIECVQTRKAIEIMRKQLLVYKLKSKPTKINFSFKLGMNRIDLWQHQNLLQTQMNDKKLNAKKIEKEIKKKESSLVLEICKLKEMEKENEDVKEKTLILTTMIQKQKIIIETLEKYLQELFDGHQFIKEKLKQNLEFHVKQFKNVNYCVNFSTSMLEKTQKLLWLEIIKEKKEILIKLFQFLEENLNEGNTVSKKEAGAEKSKNLSNLIKQIKQSAIEKSLQAIANDTEERLLNLEIKKLEEKLEKTILRANIFQKETFCQIIIFAKSEGIEARRQFFKKEICGLEDEIKSKMGLMKESKNCEENYQKILKKIDCLLLEIRNLKLAFEEQKRDFAQCRRQLQSLVENLKKEAKDEDSKNRLSEIMHDLKIYSDNQVQIFFETPLQVFKNNFSPENSLKRQLFSDFTNYFGEGFKTFLSSLLITPHREVYNVLSEVEKRKIWTEREKKMKSKMESLSEFQKEIYDELNSFKLRSDSYEKELKRSEEILRKMGIKAGELENSIECSSDILRDWSEQSFRIMVTDLETLNGKTLKDFEGKYLEARS